jgi:ubiquinone/menaquinone biosynthesis C-methylase UbiE
VGKDIIQSQYDKIASLYDILSDGDDGILFFRLNLEKLLHKIPAGSKVLDCACGTGNHAIWMAEQGYDVTASDISENMLEQAKIKAEEAEVDIHFFRSAWDELPANTSEKFMLIINPGNSFSHVADLNMLDNSIRAIKELLHPGGHFMFDLRDWSKTVKEDSMQSQEFDVESESSDFLVQYSWDLDGINTLCKMYVNIQGEADDDFVPYVFDFFTIEYKLLKERLLQAGFSELRQEFYPDGDYYFAIAK